MAMMKIPLKTKDGDIKAYALVDACDYEEVAVFCWSLNNNGYAVRGTRSRKEGWQRLVVMHRMILGLGHGDKRQGDHINGDKLDNRRSNLRIATNAQNGQNRHRARGKSRFRGVYWHKATNRWMAGVMLGGKQHHLGYFDDESDAAMAAADFRRKEMPFSREAECISR